MSDFDNFVDELNALRADNERLRIALVDADRAVEVAWEYGHTLKMLLLVAKDCLAATSTSPWAYETVARIDAALGTNSEVKP